MSCTCSCSGSCSGSCGCNCGSCGCATSSAIGANPIPAPPTSLCEVTQNSCDTATDPCCDPTLLPLEDIDVITIPEVDSSIQVSVCDTDQWPIGMCVVVVWNGTYAYLRVSAVDSDAKTVTLTNDGFAGPAAGTVTQAQTQMFLWGPCPDTVDGPTDCVDLNLFVAEAFTAPAALATALMTVSDCHSLVAGMRLRVQGLGCVEIIDTPTATQIEISVRNYEAGVSGGTTVPEGGFVHPVWTCLTTDDTLEGDGSDADPLRLAEIPHWRACYDATPGTTVVTCANAYDCNNADTPAGQPLFTGPDVAPTPLPLDVSKTDVGSVVDLVNDGIVIPKDGAYHIDVYAQVDEGITDGWYDVVLGINDDQLIQTNGIGIEIPDSGAAESAEHVFEDIVVHISGTFRFSEGDVVKAYLQYAGATGLTQITATNGIESVTFTGHFVSK